MLLYPHDAMLHPARSETTPSPVSEFAQSFIRRIELNAWRKKWIDYRQGAGFTWLTEVIPAIEKLSSIGVIGVQPSPPTAQWMGFSCKDVR